MRVALVVVLLTASGWGQELAPQISGEVASGPKFEREIGAGLVFVLQPTDSGWMAGVVPKTKCVEADWSEDFARIATPPYRSYNSLFVDASYGVRAKEVVERPPRQFSFVLTCEDFKLGRGRCCGS